MEHFCDQLYSTRLLGIRIKVDMEYDKTMLLCTANDWNGNQLDSGEKFHWIFGHRCTMQGYLFNV